MPQRPKLQLSDREIEHFRNEGFVVPRFALPPDDLALLQDLTRDLVAANEGNVDKPIRLPYLAQDPRNGPPPAGVFCRLNEHRSDRPDEWLRASSFPHVLDAAESLAGPDLILWSGVLFHKRALQGPPTPWHRDNGGNPPIDPLVSVNVWIAVHDANVENGCMRVIPRSHLDTDMGNKHFADLKSNLSVNLTLSPDAFDERLARDVELKAGQMLFFDFALVHGTNGNTGVNPRTGYTVRYLPATSRWDHDATGLWDPNRANDDEAYRTRPLFLVRGTDRAGNDFTRGHPRRAPIDHDLASAAH